MDVQVVAAAPRLKAAAELALETIRQAHGRARHGGCPFCRAMNELDAALAEAIGVPFE